MPTEALEESCEDRDDLPQDDVDDDDGDRHNRQRIDHRGVDLRLQFDVLFNVGRQTLENGVENTAGLAGGDHVDVEVVEGLRVFAHRLGEGRAAFNVLAHLKDDLLEGRVVLLLPENVETLDERKTGIDHHRKLAGEDRDVLRLDAAAELGQRDLFALLLDGGDDDLLPAECRNHRILAVADQDAGLRGAVAVAALPLKTGHVQRPPCPLRFRSRGHGADAAVDHVLEFVGVGTVGKCDLQRDQTSVVQGGQALVERLHSVFDLARPASSSRPDGSCPRGSGCGSPSSGPGSRGQSPSLAGGAAKQRLADDALENETQLGANL